MIGSTKPADAGDRHSPWTRLLAAIVSLGVVQAIVTAVIVYFVAQRTQPHSAQIRPGYRPPPFGVTVQWFDIYVGLIYGLLMLPLAAFVVGMVFRHRTAVAAAAIVAVGNTLVVLYALAASYSGDWDELARRALSLGDFMRWLAAPGSGIYFAGAVVVAGAAAWFGIAAGRAIAAGIHRVRLTGLS